MDLHIEKPSGMSDEVFALIKEAAVKNYNETLAKVREATRDMFSRFEVKARTETEWCKEQSGCEKCSDQMACSIVKLSMVNSSLMQNLEKATKALMLSSIIDRSNIQPLDATEGCNCPVCIASRRDAEKRNGDHGKA